MKFGKVEDPNSVDFSLPPNHPLSYIPSDSTKTKSIRSGGTMWNVPGWKGKVYPADVPKKDWIRIYGKQFDTIELNATHYRTPSPEQVKTWTSAVSPDFRFCPKWPQGITHYRRFRNCESQTEEFLIAIDAFGEKLGQCFMQLPPNFTAEHAPQLEEYLKNLPEDLPLSVEFRHPSWFINDASAEHCWALLKERGIGAVISATAGRRDAIHMRMTTEVLVLRYGGYDLHSSDRSRIQQWSERIAQWMDLGLNEVYLLIHQNDSIYTPETIQLFAEMLLKSTGLRIKVPQIQQGLF